MAELGKGVTTGNVILSEAPLHECRSDLFVVRDLAATEGIPAGTAMEPSIAGAVAAIQTVATAGTADGGTYRMGFQGIWTAPIAWNAVAGTVKTAFELISGTYNGVAITITASAAASINGTTITFVNTMGNMPEIEMDGRLLLDGAVVMDDIVLTTTTVGELAVHMEPAVTGGNTSGILLEPVSLSDRLLGSQWPLRRSFLVRGPSVINGDAMVVPVAQRAAALAALLALGVVAESQPTMVNTGTPRS